MRLPWISFRNWLITTVVVVFLIGGWRLKLWQGLRSMLRSEASYNAEMQGLYEAHERDLKIEIARIGQGNGDADRVFELLRTSRVANASREVATWEKARRSPDRTSVALKWAEVAANEASYMASLHRRRGQDYERGLMPHHISDQEIEPFKMPAGWTPDDSR